MLRAHRLPFAVMIAFALAAPSAVADVVGFEDLTYAPGFDYENGQHLSGSFTSGSATFGNRYYPSYDGWGGFAYSKVNDPTTPGYFNQFAAITGTGRGGSGSYGVANGYTDATLSPGDPNLAAKLQNLPNFAVPTGASVSGLYVTNTTYAYYSILQGDSFGSKPFGGADGTTPDFFLLTAYGTDAAGNALSARVDFYLADYRSSNSAEDYIVTDWRYMDLSALSGATRIFFNFTGSQVGTYGLNTPAYVAVDDIQLNFAARAVPEPASLAALAIGLGMAGAWRRSGRARRA